MTKNTQQTLFTKVAIEYLLNPNGSVFADGVEYTLATLGDLRLVREIQQFVNYLSNRGNDYYNEVGQEPTEDTVIEWVTEYHEYIN